MTMLQSCFKFFHSVVRFLWPIFCTSAVKLQCSKSVIKGDTATFYFLHLTSHFDHMIVHFTHFARSAAISDNIDTAQTMTVDRYFFTLSPS